MLGREGVGSTEVEIETRPERIERAMDDMDAAWERWQAIAEDEKANDPQVAFQAGYVAALGFAGIVGHRTDGELRGPSP